MQTEAMVTRLHAAYWFSPSSLLNSPFYRIQDHQPRDASIQNILGLPSSITNLKNALQAGIQRNLIKSFFSFPLCFLETFS